MLTQTSTAARPGLNCAIAVSARRVTRQYGDGESAVHALRGVTIEVPVGQFTAVMGPSGQASRRSCTCSPGSTARRTAA